MAVTKARIRATTKYKKNHVKRIALEVRREYWEEELYPAILSSGMSTNGFVKEALREYIEKYYS